MTQFKIYLALTTALFLCYQIEDTDLRSIGAATTFCVLALAIAIKDSYINKDN